MKHALSGYKKYIKRSKCDLCEIMYANLSFYNYSKSYYNEKIKN